MLRRGLVIFCAIVLGGCGTPTPPEDPPAQPTPTPPRTGFRFEPTLEAHRPEGSAIALVAEAGDVARGTLTLIVAHHDGSALSLAAWHFASTGEDDTLVPAGDPARMLAIRAGEQTDEDTLQAFIRTRAAGHGAAARPQGIEAGDAAEALKKLHRHATIALDPDRSPRAQVDALAAFSRGLDDDLLFSRAGLSRALERLGETAAPSRPEGSARRATVTWGASSVQLLKKGDGWTVDALR